MKKIIPRLYLVCIAIGLVIVIMANLTKNNNYVGNMWETSEEPINPVDSIQKSEYIRQYVFDTSDLGEGMNCLFFRTAHMMVRAYADEITQDNLIYEFSAVGTVFGKTSGSQYHFVEFPPTAKKVIIEVDAVYQQLYKAQLEFYQTDGIWAFKHIIQNSLVEAIISCFLIILGILLIGYWLLAGRKIDMENSALYFGCFASLLGAWTFNETGLATLMFSNRTAASLTGFILLFIMFQPMVLFMHAFLRSNETILCNICCLIISASMFLCLGLHFSGLVEMRQMAKIVHAQIVLVLLYVIYLFISYIVRYGMERRVIVNIVGIGSLVFSAFLDLGSYYAANMINDMVGRFGMLTYIVILAVEVMTDFLHQMEENKKFIYYKELATMDTLTGFHNRNDYEEWEKKATDCKDMALITFDLNNLKLCNDTKGHSVGDQYLIEAAKIIKAVFEKIGECYRIGGDEFLVVIQKASKISVDKYIQQLRRRENEYNQHVTEIEMQIACGYAVCIGDEDTIEEIRKRADASMYENKAAMKKQERTVGI